MTTPGGRVPPPDPESDAGGGVRCAAGDNAQRSSRPSQP